MMDALQTVVHATGWIVYPLMLVGWFTWAHVVLGYFALRDESMEGEPAVQRHLVAVRAGYRVAPLLGLLGTVTGIVHAFAAHSGQTVQLAQVDLGVGVGQALLSTEIGLLIAVPAVGASHALQAWERRLNMAREAS